MGVTGAEDDEEDVEKKRLDDRDGVRGVIVVGG